MGGESLKAVCGLGEHVIDRTCLKENKICLTDRSGSPYPALAFPEEFRRATNFCRQTFVHRTIERGLLKDFPLRMIGREGDVNF